MLQYPCAIASTCTEDETGKRYVVYAWTVHVGTTSKEWLSRYETTNYCILYVYVPDLYPTRSGSVWILEVDNLETNGGTGPRAVLCLAVSPGMDAVYYLAISLSSAARHVCSSLQQFNFGFASGSHVEAAPRGQVFRREPRARLPLARKLLCLATNGRHAFPNRREGTLPVSVRTFVRPLHLYSSCFYVVPSTNQITLHRTILNHAQSTVLATLCLLFPRHALIALV